MNILQAYPAPAKVNLFLHIVGRRQDGYHLLQSVFRLLDFGDTVHIGLRDDGQIIRTQEITGVPAEQDLCVRAAKLLQTHTGCTLGANLWVKKRTPMGGGLGGGSSDAATVLMVLNDLWQLKLSKETLMSLGLSLGADVPFFLCGTNAWVEGIGEIIQPISLKPSYYVVLTPQIHVATGEIFSAKELTRDTNPTTIAAFQTNEFWNDLEPVVCQRYRAVQSSLNWLGQFAKARMSGSGASVFIEVENKDYAEQVLVSAPSQMEGVKLSGFVAKGLDHHPLQHLLSL